MLIPVDDKCQHGKSILDYCPQCVYVDKAPQDVVQVQVNAVLDLEVAKHWNLTELAQAVEQYLNRYVDSPGYQPETFYLRAVHVDGNSFRKANV